MAIIKVRRFGCSPEECPIVAIAFQIRCKVALSSPAATVTAPHIVSQFLGIGHSVWQTVCFALCRHFLLTEQTRPRLIGNDPLCDRSRSGVAKSS
jgi:hypothetical protein